MKIGKAEFCNNVFLAPMAGVTDRAFREICREMQCGFAYTEMISSKALFYGNKKTQDMFLTSSKEKSVGVQIFGSDPLVMAKSCDFFNDNEKIVLVDINMGCPAHKIVKNGEGSALMKNPILASQIVKEVKRASLKPVTVKMRIGFDDRNINVIDFAKCMEQSGADAIAVHGRTSAQMYIGKANWDIIGEVKKAVKIPVIGNGDIFTAEDADRILNKTQCDGIMIGRGAMGNPWIFNQILQYVNNCPVEYPTPRERVDVCIRHYKKSIYYSGENRAVKEMRKHIAWYIKGLKNSKEIKDKINYEKHSEGVFEILDKYRDLL
ncbi:tRNA dihydrouridine synthase DusB [Clostridium sp. MT-14]|jgi:nifR3 family TIM-barrel protein|uniref:tRNA-dihydrouridine synthase n=1 Tax=Clostridium aromativorans TaxID=2836848 RepID=A0ABS8N439_9CLOT|nr:MULTISPECIES: tRNA dihydrouridine synthase DusB [Clostridium]KAA8671201.1 tRNA dihydrouridine synthase DusB [Clostridium sp. HV4-5-A1G]MCC9294552.1 tRNA dihydrouridine synthase DusB [Clostridium aromativorans]CAB1254626.1 tRNA-dihydrouridine synthase B [Clostridiaceae bacterium BL-3]